MSLDLPILHLIHLYLSFCVLIKSIFKVLQIQMLFMMRKLQYLHMEIPIHSPNTSIPSSPLENKAASHLGTY
jgi:hypothetical protein